MFSHTYFFPLFLFIYFTNLSLQATKEGAQGSSHHTPQPIRVSSEPSSSSGTMQTSPKGIPSLKHHNLKQSVFDKEEKRYVTTQIKQTPREHEEWVKGLKPIIRYKKMKKDKTSSSEESDKETGTKKKKIAVRRPKQSSDPKRFSPKISAGRRRG